MREPVLYIGFPLGVFLAHYLYLRLVMELSSQERKGWVALLNMVMYPLGMSAILGAFFLSVSHKGGGYFLSSLVVGVVAYYLSVVLAFLPFLDLIFRELDMEFFLLGLGVILGGLYPSPLLFFKSLGSLLSSRSFSLVLVFVAALVASALVKYLISRSLVVDSDRREALKNLAWAVSVSAGVVSVPLIVFFFNLGIKS